VLKAALTGAAGVALRGALGGVLGGTTRLSAAAQASGQVAPAAVRTVRLSDDLFVLSLPGQPNIVAQTTGDGVVLVDGGAAAESRTLLQAIANLPGAGPVRTMFNTHWHPEQTGSNEVLGSAGATIVAHENTRLWLTTDVTWPWDGRRFTRLPKVAQPNKTFYTADALVSGVRYGYIPDAAHTDGDLYVYFPQQNVLAVGDVVSNDSWPTVDWVTGGWIGGIVGALQRLQTIGNEETRIVPGRGPVMTMTELKAHSEMYASIYDRLTALLNKGRGPGEAVTAQPAKEFEGRMGDPDEFVLRAFESLWAYLSPDA
jgi:glyoxylase-like metal-dependent hydrolase (beta-lactamase superfamily II)